MSIVDVYYCETRSAKGCMLHILFALKGRSNSIHYIFICVVGSPFHIYVQMIGKRVANALKDDKEFSSDE